MSEYITLTVSEVLRHLFSTDRSEFESGLAGEIKAALQMHPSFFRFDCDHSRGDIQEESIAVDDLEIDDFGSGTVFYSFDEYLYMGCSNLSGDTTHENTCSFTYDPDSGEVSIPFRELPERPTDDI